MLKTSKIFACGADLPLLLDQISGIPRAPPPPAGQRSKTRAEVPKWENPTICLRKLRKKNTIKFPADLGGQKGAI